MVLILQIIFIIYANLANSLELNETEIINFCKKLSVLRCIILGHANMDIVPHPFSFK